VTRAQHGLALVAVLWIAALLAVIAGGFAFTMRTEGEIAGNLVQRAKAMALAEAGAHVGIVALLAPPESGPWHADGRWREMALGEGRVRIAITSEHAKVDLNAAPDALVHGLLEHLAGAEGAAFADGILDWRDGDDRVRPSGAEDPEYAAAGRAVGARDEPFLSVHELDQVLGATPALVARLRPLVTVHSRLPYLDAASASRDALLAIPGVTPAEVDRFLAERAQLLEQGETVRASGIPSAGRFLVTARTSVYTVAAEGVSPGGVTATLAAVVRITHNRTRPYLVLAWEPGAPMPARPPAADGLE